MEKEILTKEIAKKLMAVKGETRGFNIRLDGEYILKTRGKAGLQKVEEELEKIGCPIKYLKIKHMDFFPAGLRAISLLAIKKAFSSDDEEIRKVCAFQPKTSLITRLFVKYFFSITKVMEKIQEMWGEYWTVGELRFLEYNEKEKYAILQVRDFDLHPIFCRCLEGYFASISKIIVKAKNVNCRETKCSFENQAYHQFKTTWK